MLALTWKLPFIGFEKCLWSIDPIMVVLYVTFPLLT